MKKNKIYFGLLTISAIALASCANTTPTTSIPTTSITTSIVDSTSQTSSNTQNIELEEKETIEVEGAEANRIQNEYKIEVVTQGEDADYQVCLDEAEEIYLNFDINNVIDSVKLPTVTKRMNTKLSWLSSNIKVLGHNGTLKTTRDTSIDHEITLTATIKYGTSEIKKIYTLTIPKAKEVVPFSENTIVENFSEYVTGREISYYYDWNMTSGSNSESNGISEIIENVPNNNMISKKALQFPSYRLSTDVHYDRFLAENENFSMETYVMFTGETNGLYFEFLDGGNRGVSAGITNEGFKYYSSGSYKTSNEILDAGVWTKIRLDVNLTNSTFDYSYYDWYTNELKTIADDVVMSNKIKKVTKFRINVPSGLKNGCSYLSDLHIAPNIAKEIGANPNRTIGIGNIQGLSKEELLLEKGDVLPTPEIKVFNRFNRAQQLVEGVDYDIELNGIKETNNTGEFQRTFKIKLKETNEEKELVQNIYIDEAGGASKIRNFVSTSIMNKQVTLNGTLSKANSDVYYILVEANSKVPTKEQIKAGENYDSVTVVSKGKLTDCSGEFTVKVSNIPESKEYDIYVVTEHDGIISDYKVKNSISTVINIETCDDFYDMTVNPDTKSKTFRLMNDLDFSNYEWFINPSDTLKFLGQVDGQGYTIKNLTINNEYFDGTMIKKYGIFYELGSASSTAVIKNLRFENCSLTSFEDTGLIAGYSYNSLVENIEIDGLTIKATKGATGEGYLAAIFGRVDEGETTINNVSVVNAYIETYKYGGCIVANAQDTTLLTIKNVVFIGEVNNEGAYAGIVGRNRSPLYVENIYIDLHIRNAKKQVGLIAGQTICSGDYTGTITAKNIIGNLTVDEMMQPTYMNKGIGDYSKSDKPEDDYSIENFYCFFQDYSHLAESLEPILNSVDESKLIFEQSSYTESWWTENTCYSSLDSEYWYYDSKLERPNLKYTND